MTVGMKQFPIEVSEGRLPQNENEMVISEAVCSKCKGRLRDWRSIYS